MMLVRVTSNHFVAGIVVSGAGRITKTAPILHWLIKDKRSYSWFKSYAARKRWRLEEFIDPRRVKNEDY